MFGLGMLAMAYNMASHAVGSAFSGLRYVYARRNAGNPRFSLEPQGHRTWGFTEHYLFYKH